MYIAGNISFNSYNNSSRLICYAYIKTKEIKDQIRAK